MIIIAADGQHWVGRGQESRVTQRGDPRHSSLDHTGTRLYMRWWRCLPCHLWSLSLDYAPHKVQYEMVEVVALSFVVIVLVICGHRTWTTPRTRFNMRWWRWLPSLLWSLSLSFLVIVLGLRPVQGSIWDGEGGCLVFCGHCPCHSWSLSFDYAP